METTPSPEVVLASLGIHPAKLEDAKYFIALGRFVDQFSYVETALHRYLIRITELKPKVANALVSGAKLKSAMDFIRRIHEAQSKEPDPAYQQIVHQLGLINSIRDAVVHYGSQYQHKNKRYASNVRSAHIEKKERYFPISDEILDTMSHDLSVIELHLLACCDRFDGEDEYFRTMYGSLPPPSWLYKPTSPTRPTGR